MFNPEDYERNQVQMQQEIPGADGQEVPAQSERYGDFIVRYLENIKNTGEIPEDVDFHEVNEVFGVIYVPLEQIGEIQINGYSYNAIPKCYTYMDLESLNTSGVTRLNNHPYLQLRGSGTLVAVIDSGIDYRNSLFQGTNGSRIVGIWDQELQAQAEEPVPYGRFFSKQDIDRAMAAENPMEIVPSMDTNGHGTRLAAIAAGNYAPMENFSGAAPEASLFVVKLKPAKRYLREFYLYPSDADLFQEDDIMLAISYVIAFARERNMPVSICLGIGSSQGAHIGASYLSQYINSATNYSQVSIAIAAGNEGAARHHHEGTLNSRNNQASVELRVGENEPGFIMEFWGEAPESYHLSIQSPTGENLEISSSLGAVTQELSFVFVETKILVNYVPIERQTGNTLGYFRFLAPAPGIWRIYVKGQDDQSVKFHMWLPVQGLISDDTYFLESSPYHTVTAPGDTMNSTTVTAYQYRDGSLFVQASRGFTPNGMVTPDFAAPGVGIRVPLLNGSYGEASGSSLATAQTAGIAALMFEWAVVRENEPFFTGINVKHYLQRGARREDSMQYPNPEWGYGKIDLYHTFELLT